MRPRLLDYVAAFLAHRGAFLKRLRGLRVDSMSAAELRDALTQTAPGCDRLARNQGARIRKHNP